VTAWAAVVPRAAAVAAGVELADVELADVMATGSALTGAAPTAVVAGAGCSPVRAYAGGARPGAAGPAAALRGSAFPGVARHGVAGPGRGAVAPRRGIWAPGRSAPAGVGPACRGLASPRSSSVPRWPAGRPLRLVRAFLPGARGSARDRRIRLLAKLRNCASREIQPPLSPTGNATALERAGHTRGSPA